MRRHLFPAHEDESDLEIIHNGYQLHDIVIEVMKMENVLYAAKDSTVEKILAQTGESLAVDQPIVELG